MKAKHCFKSIQAIRRKVSGSFGQPSEIDQIQINDQITNNAPLKFKHEQEVILKTDKCLNNHVINVTELLHQCQNLIAKHVNK